MSRHSLSAQRNINPHHARLRVVLALASIFLLSVACSGPFGSKKKVTAGVAKTENGGVDWVLVNTLEVPAKKKGKTTTSSIASAHMSLLAFGPKGSNRLYAASSNSGLYLTEDGAKTWKKILSKVSVRDLSIDPKDPEHLYAAGSVAGLGKVLESKDGGKSWVEVYSDASPDNPVRGIAVHPQNSQVVFLGLSSGAILKSSDGGQTWTAHQEFKDKILRLRWQGDALYVFLRTFGLYRSSDNGQTFENISDPILNLYEYYLERKQRTDDPYAPEQRDLPKVGVEEFYDFAVSPNNPKLIYITTNSGLFKSVDGGKTYTYLRLPLRGDSVSVWTIGLGPNDEQVYASVNNIIYKTLNGGQTWQVQTVATKAFINYILVDPDKPQVVYVGLSGE